MNKRVLAGAAAIILSFAAGAYYGFEKSGRVAMFRQCVERNSFRSCALFSFTDATIEQSGLNRH